MRCSHGCYFGYHARILPLVGLGLTLSIQSGYSFWRLYVGLCYLAIGTNGSLRCVPSYR